MGRGKKLTETGKGKISTFHEVGESIHSIARKIGRSRGVVSNFLQNNIAYGTKYVNCGRKNILSPRTKRKMANEASNSTKSAELIKGQLNLDASRTTVWRAIKENSNIIRSKLNVCSSMKPHHKIARLNFGKNNMNRDWTKVIFSDEKKFVLDGPDGFNGYWRDLRKEPLIFSKRNFGGGSQMVWAAFNANGTVAIEFVSSKMNSSNYIDVLKNNLLPYLLKIPENTFVFQQDNASIHASKETKNWFTSKNINVLEWPANSPDCNPAENLWGMLVRDICAGNRQYTNIPELRSAILQAWACIDQKSISNLINSMTTRIFQLINRSGGLTDY